MDGFETSLEIAFDTAAGPAVRHGPQAEPDSPPLAPVTVAALGALGEVAAADGVTVRLEHPAAHPLAVVAGDDADPRPRWACPRSGVVTSLPPLG